MASDANGALRVPVWSDGGIVKPIVNDDGRLPISVEESLVTQDVNIASSDIDVPVSIDAATIDVPISIEACKLTLPVQEQSPLTSIQAQGYGWDLTNWRKLPMIWGISSNLLVAQNATAVGAGGFYASESAVPTGYVYVYTAASIAQVTGAAADVQIGIHIGGLYYWIEAWQSCANGKWYGRQIHFILTAGQNLLATTIAVAAGDALYLRANGYAMKVNE
jgi:hypothetical protein